MKVYRDIESLSAPDGSIVTIGNFDGVHLGHRRLIEAARQHAQQRSVPVVAITFEPHPLAVLVPERAPATLTTLPEKLSLLELEGVDAAIVLQSTRELLGMSAESFLRRIVEACRPHVIVEGPTFNFGRKREGDTATLREFAQRFGYETHIVEELHCEALAGHPAINSSTIRKALGEGHLTEANLMLGRAYRITGTVGSGDHRGTTLGFPTANLDQIPQLLPKQAVYAAVAQLDNETLHLAAVNIGPQPTFDQASSRVEAFLLDYEDELRGKHIGLNLLAKMREQRRFDSSSQLIVQLERDVRETRAHAAQLAEMRGRSLLPL